MDHRSSVIPVPAARAPRGLRRARSAAAFILLPLAGAACRGKARGPAAGSLPPSFMQVPVAARPAPSEATVARGRELYAANCVQCHGPKGAGDGYGAPFLIPPPRDFTSANFKFRTTASGQLPTDEDLFRTISRGADGTGMPPWSYMLKDDERWALVDYVKTFSPRFASGVKPAQVEVPPPPAGAADPAKGREVYERMGCVKCHGAEGRGDGPSARALRDNNGRIINSRDFTNPGGFRTGWSREEIARTMLTGMNGTPMPAFRELASSPENLYNLAAYILGFAKAGSGDQKRHLAHSMEGVGSPARVIAVREHAWKFEPAEIRIKRGEVVRIDFSATDNGLGAGHGFAIDGYDRDIFINGAVVGRPLSVTFRIDQAGRYTFYCATQCSTEQLHPNMKGLLIVE